VSEISPFLRRSQLHKHLAGLDSALIATSHAAPRSEEEDARLFELMWWLERVLHKAYELVDDIMGVDAQTLNSFQEGTTSQDPFQRLQNKRSFNNYVKLWQALLCYYVRVFEGHFGEEREMFKVPEDQQDIITLAIEASVDLIRLRSIENTEPIQAKEDDASSAT